MDNIYDTLAKLNKVANAPEIVKEDSNALMKKGLEDLMKKTKLNKQADYTPFSDKQSPDGLPEKKKDDKMFEGPSGQSKHELIRQLFKSHFGQPDYNEPTGGRSGMRRLKKITGVTQFQQQYYGVSNDDNNPRDTSDFEKQLKAAGLSDQVRVKSDGYAVTVLYPDDFRMQSLAEAELVEKESNEKHDKDGMHENAGTLKDAARQGVLARLAELAGLPVQEIEEALGTPQDVAAKIMAENPLDEADVEEGNEFSGERDKAIKAGKDSFEVDGKTYPVKGDKNKSLSEKRKPKIEKPDNLTTAIEEIPSDGFNYDNMEDIGFLYDNIQDGLYGDDFADYADKIHSDLYAILDLYKQAAEQQADHDVPSSPSSPGVPIPAEIGQQIEALKANIKASVPNIDNAMFQFEDSKLESKTEGKIEEAEHDGMPSMKEMKACVDKGMTEAEICEKYSDCDQDKIKLMASKCSKMDEGTGSKVCDQCEDGKDEDGKECSECGGTGYSDLAEESEEKVEETTSGSIAPAEAGGKPLFKNASVYESNEIVKRAKQLNEDMNISVNAGTNAEPSININASGEEAAKLAQLLKLAGMGMAQPGYGEVQVDVAEDQEFANGADDTNTMDTEYMTQDIAGGLNGPKKMAYPKVAGGDNPMSVLGESELNEVSEDHLMKLYQEYKAK